MTKTRVVNMILNTAGLVYARAFSTKNESLEKSCVEIK